MHLSSAVTTAIALSLLIPSTLGHPNKHRPSALEDNTYTNRHNHNVLNELSPMTLCRNISLLYVRGSHTKGNVGKAGPFFDALANITDYDNLAVQGVDYPATILDYLFGHFDKGVSNLRAKLRATMDRCPDTKLVVTGYSQGAMVVRKFAEEATPEEVAFIRTVLLFGDPNKMPNGPHGLVMPPVGRVPDDRILEVCHKEDPFCHGHKVSFKLRYHRLYFRGDCLKKATDWLAKHLGLRKV